MGEIILQAKNIDKSFSNGKTNLSVLKDFSLDVAVGQIITIMGQSGSGKTTALNILGTLDQADSGELTINGTHVHDMNEAELSTIRNRDIGFVFQFLFQVYFLYPVPLFPPGKLRQIWVTVST